MKQKLFFLLLIYLFYSFIAFGQNDQEVNQTKKQRFLNQLLSPQPSYVIPKDSSKLKLRKNEFKFHFGIQRMENNIWAKDYMIPPELSSDALEVSYQRSFDAPNLWQLQLGLEFNPWLKAGILSHRRKGFMSEAYLSDNGPGLSASTDFEVEFGRSWGAYIEFTPYPVKALRLRRYEFNIGGAYVMETISTHSKVRGSYLDNFDEWRGFLVEENMALNPWSLTVYGGVTVFILPWLSTQFQVGYYMVPEIPIDPLVVNLPPSYPDFQINSENLNVSWHYYSLGLNIHL